MFKILNNQGAVARHQVLKEVAKPQARELLKEKIGEEEFKAKTSYFKNSEDAIRNSRQYHKDYERTLPETLAPEVKNTMWKRAKQLKDEFVIGMLSREELHPVKGFMENGTMKWVVDDERIRANRSVEREVAWQKVNDAKVKEFKNLMRHLDPENPNAGDVEKFRVKGRGK